MNPIKQPFYCDLYHKTGGFFPTFPENQTLFLGDFFQIQSGKCLPLGNIGDLEFLEPIVMKGMNLIESEGLTKKLSKILWLQKGKGDNE